MLNTCPLVDCQNRNAKISHLAGGTDGYYIECPNCGSFEIGATLAHSTTEWEQNAALMAGLRAYVLAENAERRVPTLNSPELWCNASQHQPSAFSTLFGQ